MNPLLARLHPYPFERWRELTVGVQHRGDLSPISLGIGEPRHATPALIEQAITGSLKGLSIYPPTIGEPALARGLRRVAHAPLWRARGSGDATAAGERLARSTVRAGAGGARCVARRRHRGVPEPLLSNLRGRGAAGRRAHRVRQQRPGAQLRRRLVADRCRHLVAHAAGVRVLAGQPHWRGDAAVRMAHVVRAVAIATAS